MKTIKLRNYKSQFIIFGLISLGLAFVLIYWALVREGNLIVSGAKIDTTTSKWLLFIISTAPLLAFLNQFILYLSYIKYGDFVISLRKDKIEYPVKKSFSGFSKISIDKDKIKEVKLIHLAKQEKAIRFYNHKNQFFSFIPGDFAPYKTMKPDEMFLIIDIWVKDSKTTQH